LELISDNKKKKLKVEFWRGRVIGCVSMSILCVA
jgi:hypothetical protein